MTGEWTVLILTTWVALFVGYVTLIETSHGKRVERSDMTVMNPRFRSHARRKQEVMLGDRLKLRCDAVSKPRSYVHWYRNNELLSKGQTKPRMKISQFSLTITRVEPGDEGQYACKVWNQVGQIWRNFTVVIIDLDEWKKEMNIAARNAERIRQQHALLNKNPEQISEWLDPEWQQKFGSRLKPPVASQTTDSEDDKKRYEEDSENESNEQQNDLTTSANRREDDRRESSDLLSRIVATSTTPRTAGMESPLSMEDRPQNDFAPWWDRTGMGLTDIRGLPPFVGSMDPMDFNANSTIRTTQRVRPKPTYSTTTVPPALLLDTWERAPYWQKHEQEMLQVIATPAGRSVKLPCRANGKPEPQVLWYKDGVEISADTDRNSGYTYVIKKWALVLEDVVPSDEGVYTCKVFNKLGEISHNYTLKVVERLPHKPIIAPEMPKNLTQYVGENATFRCVVLSDLHPHIEWLRHYTVNGSYHSDDGQPYVYRVHSDPEIEESEDGYQDPTFLFIKNVTADDEGWYTCLAGNNIGITYRTVYLTVLQRRENELPAAVANGQVTDENWTYKNSLYILLGSIAIVLFFVVVAWKRWHKGKKHRHQTLRPMGSDIANGFERERKTVRLMPPKDYVARSLSSASSLLFPGDEFPVPHVEILSSPDNRCRLSTQLTALSDYDIQLDEEWKIQPDALRLERSIGEGAFGEVWCAKLTSPSPAAISLGSKATLDPQIVAVKTLKCSATDRELCDLIKELEVMKSIGRHQNIINLLGYSASCERGKPLYVVVEYCANGNLRDYLRSQRPQPNQSASNSAGNGSSSGQKQSLYGTIGGAARLGVEYEEPNSRRLAETSVQPGRVIYTEFQLAQLIHQIARGMEFLSNKKCVHRDLAARNVLVTDDLIMKIADFGLARNVSETDYYKKLSDGRLPLKWMAPEALFDRTYTIKSDVWSFGILVWEVMTLGGTPYPSVPHQELFRFLREGNRMEQPHHCSEDVYRLMRACWNQEKEDRPTFKDIVEYLDSFLTQANPEDYLEVQSQAPIEEYGENPVLAIEDTEVVDEARLDAEVDETTSMLPTNGVVVVEPASIANSPSPPDSPIDGDVAVRQQNDRHVDSSCQRASTSFSDSACSVDADMPSTSSPRSSTSSSVNLRLNSMANSDYTHHRLSASPLPSPREKLRPISEVFNELDMESYEDRSSTGGGRGANDSGHPSSRGGSYEGSSDSVDSGHSFGGTSSSDSYNDRRHHQRPPPPGAATSLRRHHQQQHRRRNFVVSQP